MLWKIELNENFADLVVQALHPPLSPSRLQQLHPCGGLRWTKSPITSVQWARWTLAGHSAIPLKWCFTGFCKSWGRKGSLILVLNGMGPENCKNEANLPPPEALYDPRGTNVAQLNANCAMQIAARRTQSLSVFGWRYDCQWTLVIRLVVIALASDSAILSRFCPSKVAVGLGVLTTPPPKGSSLENTVALQGCTATLRPLWAKRPTNSKRLSLKIIQQFPCKTALQIRKSTSPKSPHHLTGNNFFCAVPPLKIPFQGWGVHKRGGGGIKFLLRKASKYQLPPYPHKYLLGKKRGRGGVYIFFPRDHRILASEFLAPANFWRSGVISSLQGLQKCCREIISSDRAWKPPWKMPWKFLAKCCCSHSSGNESRKCPELFMTNFTPVFARRFFGTHFTKPPCP